MPKHGTNPPKHKCQVCKHEFLTALGLMVHSCPGPPSRRGERQGPAEFSLITI